MFAHFVYGPRPGILAACATNLRLIPSERRIESRGFSQIAVIPLLLLLVLPCVCFLVFFGVFSEVTP